MFPLREYDIRKDEERYFYPKVFKSYVLTLDSKSLKGHTKLLASELRNVTKDLGFESLIFLGDNKNYWLTKLSLGRKDYKLLEDALQYLLNNKVGKKFNGALNVDNAELPSFIKHFFCLVRCDASLPYFHFMDARQSFVGSICQYGNLHIDTLNQKTDYRFKKVLTESKFKNVEDGKCYTSFSKTSAIKTRHTSV
ncbi:MAG TPA: hypothetical protein VNG53_07200 [Bacteroidia bacterium]|nr:hypothetical protein [Bacteroidia bacterium]